MTVKLYEFYRPGRPHVAPYDPKKNDTTIETSMAVNAAVQYFSVFESDVAGSPPYAQLDGTGV